VNQLLIATSARLLAEGTPHNTGPDFGKASPFGLLVIVLLVIATLFLLRSMNRQLKKVPKSFDRENPELDQAADDGTDTVGGAEHEPRPGSGDEPG
jgi:hypothetical protein